MGKLGIQKAKDEAFARIPYYSFLATESMEWKGINRSEYLENKSGNTRLYSACFLITYIYVSG